MLNEIVVSSPQAETPTIVRAQIGSSRNIGQFHRIRPNVDSPSGPSMNNEVWWSPIISTVTVAAYLVLVVYIALYGASIFAIVMAVLLAATSLMAIPLHFVKAKRLRIAMAER